ncbi:interleukin-13 [Canis lupus dingo]|uniref:interleukin-13 n=1 Tax=Canis lupus dingo TaxID=286419 RepID=UPI0020C2A5B9|nr:interleukin-13 [Canis lupus dingo]
MLRNTGGGGAGLPPCHTGDACGVEPLETWPGLTIVLPPQASLCNGSMVWSVNLTAGMYCAALESLINVSDCSAIQRTQRMLKALCSQKPAAGQISSERSRDTKIEVIQLVKNLLTYVRGVYRHGNFR